MPQDELFDSRVRWTGFRFDVEEVLHPEGRRWHMKIYRRDAAGAWRTVWIGAWEGVMLDFTQTLASESASAFMFGEAADLARVCGTVHRMARAHLSAHNL